jgi:hypothetical protein
MVELHDSYISLYATTSSVICLLLCFELSVVRVVRVG